MPKSYNKAEFTQLRAEARVLINELEVTDEWSKTTRS